MKTKKVKNKIKKSVRNRFKVTKTGKVLRLSASIGHLKRNKTKKQLRRLKRAKTVSGKMATKVKKLLGYK